MIMRRRTGLQPLSLNMQLPVHGLIRIIFAAAALSGHDQVMRNLGAEIMTGGGNDFYKRIGYQGIHRKLHMKKRQKNVNDTVKEILEITGFDFILDVED